MSSERRQWNAKLFGCAEDWNTCCRVFWFPCVEHAEQGQFILERSRKIYWIDLSVYLILWFLCLEWTVGALRREDIRRKYNIPAKPYEDLVTHLFCHPCASCQESRQLRIRMSNPSARLSQPPSRGNRNDGPNLPAVIFERHADYVISGGVKEEITSPMKAMT